MLDEQLNRDPSKYEHTFIHLLMITNLKNVYLWKCTVKGKNECYYFDGFHFLSVIGKLKRESEERRFIDHSVLVKSSKALPVEVH